MTFLCKLKCQFHHTWHFSNLILGLPVALAFERNGYNVSGTARSKEKAAILVQNESMFFVWCLISINILLVKPVLCQANEVDKWYSSPTYLSFILLELGYYNIIILYYHLFFCSNFNKRFMETPKTKLITLMRQ